MPYDDEIGRRYPHILFGKSWTLAEDVVYKIGQCDAIVQAISRIPVQPEFQRELLNVSLTKGAQATTAIEGNSLTEAEVERVAQGASLPPSKEYQEREVRNILDAMNELLRAVASDGQVPLISEELIRSFHRMVGRELGEHFDAVPSQFRTDERIVGPYKCPRAEHVQELVRRLCEWLPREFVFPSGQQTFAQAVVQAVVTHVYIEWIHPFGDGNGRTGRLLEFYILLLAGNPDIGSHILSNHYNETRPEYYRQLDRASKERDLTSFLRYALQGYLDGLTAVLERVLDNSLKVAWRHLVYDRFADRAYHKKTVFKRRRALALALPPGQPLSVREIALVTPELTRQYAVVSSRTLLRDVEELQEMDLVVEKNGAYEINLGLLRSLMPRRLRKPSMAA